MAMPTDPRARPMGPARTEMSLLVEKYEVVKEIGDGSFGSVSLARVRAGGNHIAKRNTMVAVKTMKKTFSSFTLCLELREIIFLRSLQPHPHLVSALDIFLDPTTQKLHIAMEFMDGNLYQLMKARDHKAFDNASVKSILYQIMSGLEHIHDSSFFHRDIKPENILVTVSPPEAGGALKRYSHLVSPPPTISAYTVKIADFGLAREVQSRLPYTTYVSTRWYRAPEVLLRAGEYSAPVDIWAVGAMAVEIATLKPLFPGSNEVDQVWRVCEIMGSPGNWVTKDGERVGGGKWNDGQKLAQKLGFAFPKMMPHGMDAILPAPQWPAPFRKFVTQCLMWDPNNRPTTSECLRHGYFHGAYDPARRPMSPPKVSNRRNPDVGHAQPSRSVDTTPSLGSRTSSWLRKSLVARDSSTVLLQSNPEAQVPSDRSLSFKPALMSGIAATPVMDENSRPSPPKRNTWITTGYHGAPMPILPSIRPVSPLSNTVTARAHAPSPAMHTETVGKVRLPQNLVHTGGDHSEPRRPEAEQSNGRMGAMSPLNNQKEGFLSHLRKRARRLSGRHPSAFPTAQDDLDSHAGSASWSADRNSLLRDPSSAAVLVNLASTDHDTITRNTGYANDERAGAPSPTPGTTQRVVSHPALKRHHSLPHAQMQQPANLNSSTTLSRTATRRPHKPLLPAGRYETPDEQDELRHEALESAYRAFDNHQLPQAVRKSYVPQSMLGSVRGTRRAEDERTLKDPRLTPSPSGLRDLNPDGRYLSHTHPIDVKRPKVYTDMKHPFPTPPDDDNDWAASAAASILASGELWR